MVPGIPTMKAKPRTQRVWGIRSQMVSKAGARDDQEMMRARASQSPMHVLKIDSKM
jgi:hypothetical protein